MNIPLLRRIQRRIDKAPDRFAMDHLIIEKKGCGTAMCIAGWAIVLSGNDESSIVSSQNPSARGLDASHAAEHLEIDGDQYQKLFWTKNWPVQFRDDDSDPTLPAKAIARIDWFIATEGRE